MSLGSLNSLLPLRIIFADKTERFLRVMREVGRKRALMVWRSSLVNSGLRRVFTWEVGRKHCVYKEKLKK